jgi:hypothetical protein
MASILRLAIPTWLVAMTMIPAGLLGTILAFLRGRPKVHWLGGTLACFVAAFFLAGVLGSFM